jgi:hypothetical protein
MIADSIVLQLIKVLFSFYSYFARISNVKHQIGQIKAHPTSNFQQTTNNTVVVADEIADS